MLCTVILLNDNVQFILNSNYDDLLLKKNNWLKLINLKNKCVM